METTTKKVIYHTTVGNDRIYSTKITTVLPRHELESRIQEILQEAPHDDPRRKQILERLSSLNDMQLQRLLEELST